MEQPQYSLKPSISSILLGQIVKLVVLCALFYGGIYMNFKIIEKEVPLWITGLVVIILLALIILQIILTKTKATKHHYDFFSNRIEFFGKKVKSILYQNIAEVKLKRSIFDTISGTGSLILSKDFKITNITNYTEVQNYLNQLIQNYRNTGFGS